MDWEFLVHSLEFWVSKYQCAHNINKSYWRDSRTANMKAPKILSHMKCSTFTLSENIFVTEVFSQVQLTLLSNFLFNEITSFLDAVS